MLGANLGLLLFGDVSVMGSSFYLNELLSLCLEERFVLHEILTRTGRHFVMELIAVK